MIISLLSCCINVSDRNIDYEKKLDACLGSNTSLVLDDLINCFEDFLVNNNFASSHKDIKEGYKKYVIDSYNGIHFDSLIFDTHQNIKLISKLESIGYIKAHDTIEKVQFVDGSPLFDPYIQYVPCLWKSVSDTTTLFYYYAKEKLTVGSLATPILSWYITNWATDRDYESKILKEIIIFEFYMGPLIDHSR